MNPLYAVLTGIAILVALYMTYPRFQRRRLSSARFFKDLPPPRKGQSRLRLGRLEFNLPFFLQWLVLMIILASLYWIARQMEVDETGGVGVWIMVDTSASMSTIQDGKPRMVLAVSEVEGVVEKVLNSAGRRECCFRLSTLDLERRDILEKGDGVAVLKVVGELQPRLLGTDISIIRGVLSLGSEGVWPGGCSVHHLVVVTDLPAPSWLGESKGLHVVWLDISKPVDNVGFTGIHAPREPLTGRVGEVGVEITAYGTPVAGVHFSVIVPGGVKVIDQVITWEHGKTWQMEFIPATAGTYELAISGGGAYKYDDLAVIDIEKGEDIRVDWELEDRKIPGMLGWVQSEGNPDLRVTRRTSGFDRIPTLIVGPGYNSSPVGGRVEIRDFMELSPLLVDVNFDAVEMMELPGIRLPQGFQPVLRGIDGAVWLAQASEPNRAYVPGLPTDTDDVKGRFSAVVFFNAVRWLLEEREIPPLYTLTSVHAQEPGRNRLTLHPEEGNTGRKNQSSGKLEDLKVMRGQGTSQPLWPILLMAAVFIFMIERAYQLFHRK